MLINYSKLIRNPSRLSLYFKQYGVIIDYKQTSMEPFGARAGIRTRVDGMKTRNDGPGYTTRATDNREITC